MPKLATSAKALKRVRDKNWQVHTMLPDIEEIAESATGIVTTEYLGAQFAFQSAMIWQESSQIGLGAIATNLGIPAMQVFRSVVDVMDVDIVAEVTDKLVDAYGNVRDAISAMKVAGDSVDGGEAMAKAVELGATQAAEMAISTTKVVPIVYAIIKIAWGVGKFIKNVVNIVKNDSYGEAVAIYPPSNFDTTLDNRVLNDSLGDLRNTRDWTRLFGPPRLGEGQGNSPDFWSKVIGKGAREIFRVHGRNDQGGNIDWLGAGWTGFVPGTAMLHQGVRLTGNTGASEIGSILLPSAQQLLFWIWKEITGKGRDASPSLYTVDSKVVGDAWAGYISDFHVWLSETDQIGTASKEAILEFYNGAAGKKIFGWGTSLEFGGDKEMERYQPVKEAQILRKRQWAMLDTLLCAYVDESFVAIESDSQLRAQWRKRRQQLLEHPARCNVDLEVVPAGEWRDELKRRLGPAACAQASLNLAWLPPVTPPDGQGGAAGLGEGEDEPGTTRSGGGTKLLLAGAAVAGLFLAHKKGWI